MRKIKGLGSIALALAMVVTMIPAAAPKAAAPGNYQFVDDFTLGYQNGVVAYVNGQRASSLQAAGVKVYNKRTDNPFEAQREQAWDEPELILSQPVKYTTNDGVAHDVESMLTNWNFIADPTAIDNSEVDGKIYVYGTTEGFSWNNDGTMKGNGYANHSLTILSSQDMVNWTDEGFVDTRNLTNEPSTSSSKVGAKFTGGNTWAPSGLKIDGDGDGENEYYIFYTNGGATGYVMADSPVGPWKEPLGKELCGKSLPNCSDCNTCFDPGVIADPNSPEGEPTGYVYFGGLTRTSGRVVKIKFAPGTGEVLIDGDPIKMATHAFFEDNEVNYFNDKYYYSYCCDWGNMNGLPTTGGSICVYVGDDPLNIAFDPNTTTDKNGNAVKLNAFTDEDGTYHHYLGTVLDNPSTIYGQSYNNHHHMQDFKGHMYIFYHSTVLNNSIHRASNQYRNLHVDEIEVDEETDKIQAIDGRSKIATYDGAAQIEDFNPYFNFDGSKRYVSATCTSYSAGVKSLLEDQKLGDASLSGTPMVLDCIDTGDWTKLQGVDLGKKCLSISAEYKSETNEGAIEVFLDDPTDAENMIASIPVKETAGEYEMVKASVADADVSGKHDVYFVFRGTDYNVATWEFEGSESAVAEPTPSAPTVSTAPQTQATPAPQTQATPAPQTSAPVAKAAIKVVGKKTVKVGKTLKLKAKLTNVKGKVKWSVNKKKLATISKAGKLKAKKKGTVKVTAKIGKVKGTLKIKIK